MALTENKQFLLNGYCRINKIEYIPNDIINIIARFYNQLLIWSITDEKMNKVRNATYKQVLYGPQLQSKDFTFQLTLCPMGWRQEGYMEFYIELEFRK